MLPSVGLRLAWLQMGKGKKNGPPEKPNDGLGHEHEAIWSFLMHLNGRIDGLHALFLSATVAGLVLLAGIFVTVLVK